MDKPLIRHFSALLYSSCHTRLGKTFLIKEKNREKMENGYTHQEAIRERCSQIVSRKGNGIVFAQQKVSNSTFSMEDQPW